MASTPSDALLDRRSQILRAGMVCFAKNGFHQTSMHDIASEAGVSVGLIYRYFENKEAVITEMGQEHMRSIHEMLERARRAPTLMDALEIFFTAHCCHGERRLESAFVVDLFAEGARNPHVAALVREVLETVVGGVADLIAQSPEARQIPNGLTPHEIAELIFAAGRGLLMRDAVDHSRVTDAERLERQLHHLRQLWRVLFTHANEPAFA